MFYRPYDAKGHWRLTADAKADIRCSFPFRSRECRKGEVQSVFLVFSSRKSIWPVAQKPIFQREARICIMCDCTFCTVFTYSPNSNGDVQGAARDHKSHCRIVWCL